MQYILDKRHLETVKTDLNNPRKYWTYRALVIFTQENDPKTSVSCYNGIMMMEGATHSIDQSPHSCQSTTTIFDQTCPPLMNMVLVSSPSIEITTGCCKHLHLPLSAAMRMTSKTKLRDRIRSMTSTLLWLRPYLCLPPSRPPPPIYQNRVVKVS
jgi:hypothetical protein